MYALKASPDEWLVEGSSDGLLGGLLDKGSPDRLLVEGSPGGLLVKGSTTPDGSMVEGSPDGSLRVEGPPEVLESVSEESSLMTMKMHQEQVQ